MQHQKSIGISEFKAKCLSLLLETSDHGKSFTITKKGNPIAEVRPISKKTPKKTSSRFGSLKGIITIHTDLAQIDLSNEWDHLR